MLKKKIAQMFIVAIPLLPEEEMLPLVEDYVRRGIGGFMIGVGGKLEAVETKGVTDIKKLKNLIKKLKSLDPSLFLAIDGEGGNIFNLFEHVAKLKSGRDYGELFEKNGDVEEFERDIKEYVAMMKDVGINMNFAPVLDAALPKYEGYMADDRRSYSDHEETVMRLSSVMVEQMQSNNIVAVGKHFPGYGPLRENPHEVLRMQEAVKSSDEVLLPFNHAVQGAKIMALMKGHCLSPLDPKVPASLSEPVESYLRNDMAFDGLTVIDEVFMKAIREYYGGVGADKNGRRRIVDAAKVNDVLLVSYPRQKADGTIKGEPEKHNRFPRLLNAVYKAVMTGDIPRSAIDVAYERIIRVKKRIGLC